MKIYDVLVIDDKGRRELRKVISEKRELLSYQFDSETEGLEQVLESKVKYNYNGIVINLEDMLDECQYRKDIKDFINACVKYVVHQLLETEKEDLERE